MNFAHLAIDARRHYRHLVDKTKIFQMIDALFCLGVR
jgi:uncharacterized membrane protein (DUF485 family)